jgi:hypothetical protein
MCLDDPLDAGPAGAATRFPSPSLIEQDRISPRTGIPLSNRAAAKDSRGKTQRVRNLTFVPINPSAIPDKEA